MKKIFLEPVRQYNEVFYTGKINPRLLIHLVSNIEVGEVQDAQRPLEEKHLRDISKYVGAEKGILPGSVMLSTKRNGTDKLLRVQSEERTYSDVEGNNHSEKRYFILIPDSPDELEEYHDTLDIIDGQHRIFSFRDDFRSPDLKEDTTYEITFSLFELPLLAARQMLFMVTNEKQKAVNGNLLLWLRLQLQLLSDKEEKYLPLVSLLSNENASPLKGRIIMSAEKIPKGYKAKELVKILAKTFSSDLLIGTELSQDEKFEAICRYLRAWELFYDLSFQSPQKDTMTKISGLRYILWLFPFFWKQSFTQKQQWNDVFVRQMLSNLRCALNTNLHLSDMFADSAVFRGEGATDKAVKDHIRCYELWLAEQNQSSFNPLA